jgi:hypothetical protein
VRRSALLSVQARGQRDDEDSGWMGTAPGADEEAGGTGTAHAPTRKLARWARPVRRRRDLRSLSSSPPRSSALPPLLLHLRGRPEGGDGRRGRCGPDPAHSLLFSTDADGPKAETAGVAGAVLPPLPMPSSSPTRYAALPPLLLHGGRPPLRPQTSQRRPREVNRRAWSCSRPGFGSRTGRSAGVWCGSAGRSSRGR